MKVKVTENFNVFKLYILKFLYYKKKDLKIYTTNKIPLKRSLLLNGSLFKIALAHRNRLYKYLALI